VPYTLFVALLLQHSCIYSPAGRFDFSIRRSHDHIPSILQPTARNNITMSQKQALSPKKGVENVAQSAIIPGGGGPRKSIRVTNPTFDPKGVPHRQEFHRRQGRVSVPFAGQGPQLYHHPRRQWGRRGHRSQGQQRRHPPSSSFSHRHRLRHRCRSAPLRQGDER